MSRKQSREFAMQLIYQIGLRGGEDRNELIELAYEESENEYSDNDRAYIEDVVNGVFSNLKELDKVVSGNAKGWKLGRIARIDLSILRLSIYEIKYRDDISFNISINEAVELAKKYGTEDSGSFINGILGKAVPSDNYIKKGPADGV